MAHAICSNEVTCARIGCHHPGTVVVTHRCPPVAYEQPDGTARVFEGPAVGLEYCPECAGRLADL